jgi:hypothetical protein
VPSSGATRRFICERISLGTRPVGGRVPHVSSTRGLHVRPQGEAPIAGHGAQDRLAGLAHPPHG